ncbi:MAG: outer membrane beta-barrel protein, partial [Cyclobacteriaceae bacterium]
MRSYIKPCVTTLLIGCLASSAIAQAETTKAYKFHFGITSGIHVTALKVTQDYYLGYGTGSKTEYNAQMGYSAGIPFEITKNHFFLSGSLLFMKDNAQAVNKSITSQDFIKSNFNFTWAVFPVTFNYTFIQKSNHKLFAGVGIATRRLFNVRSEIFVVNGATTFSGPKIDTSDTFEKWSWFGKVVIGTDLKIANKLPLTVTLSFDQSLMNLANEFQRTNSTSAFDYGFIQPDVSMNS